MAYAALVSLELSLKQIMLYPDQHSVHHDLRTQIQSFLPKLEYLQEFLESSSRKTDEETCSLITRIRDATYEAQDTVDLYCYQREMAITGRVLDPDSMDLQNIIQEIDAIESDIREHIGSTTEEATNIEYRSFVPDDLQLQKSFRAAGSSKRASKNMVVGFEDHIIRIMDELMGQRSALSVVPILGMGGIGKTTLAYEIYNNPSIMLQFDFRAWVVISRSYTKRNMLLHILDSMEMLSDEMLDEDHENELTGHLYQALKGKRYLITIDDVWDNSVWDEMKMVFPNDDNGSRILLTTRLADVAAYVSSWGYCHNLFCLSEEQSWTLLCSKVFGDEKHCPLELEQIGRKISQRCQGLPLSLVVMGGLLLSRTDKTEEGWLDVVHNVISISDYDLESSYLRLLKLSYDYLPQRLKPCFLYMARFKEDEEISVSKLIKLWVAEGFLKQDEHQNPEAVAEKSLKELVDRNMIIISKQKFQGKIKTCRIHDLLLDLCIREADKEKFLCVMTQKTPHNHLRLSIHSKTPDLILSDSISSFSLVRSLLYTGREVISSSVFLKFKLLRVLDAIKVAFPDFPSQLLELVNLRYMSFTCPRHIPPSISNLQNLQTLIIHEQDNAELPVEIWNMAHLRHIEFENGSLPYPVGKQLGIDGNPLVLTNLRTLSGIKNLRFTKDVVARIQSIERLEISYDNLDDKKGWSYYEFHNLANLRQLGALKIYFHSWSKMMRKREFQFPRSLKELTLSGFDFSRSSFNFPFLSYLPNLEVLKLKSCLMQPVWIQQTHEFRRLKLLLLQRLDLLYWEIDLQNHDNPFPCLERLIVRDCDDLDEIPRRMGEISTLDMIECDKRVLDSAKRIQEMQHARGNHHFQLLLNTANPSFSSRKTRRQNSSINDLITKRNYERRKRKEEKRNESCLEDLGSAIESIDETKQQKIPRLAIDSWSSGWNHKSSMVGFHGDFSQTKDTLQVLLSKSIQSTTTKEGIEDPPRSYSEGVSIEEGQKGHDNDEENKISMDMLFNNIYIKDCIRYCSLFPTTFEFTKDVLASLWIAQGWTRAIEEACIRCFDILFNVKYIVPTGYDPYGDQIKYKVGEEMHAFLQDHLIRPQFSKQLDGNYIEDSKLEHLSLSFKEICQINFEIIKKLSRLQTLMIHGCYGFEHLPFDLFLELKSLRILILSHTDVVELPNSIECSKELRYLDMSETPIRWLPESMCNLRTLQTLKLDNCLGLIRLPKRMKQLINLRHLILDVARQLQSMPEGIGNLSELRTLRAFLVGVDDGCCIDELKHMNKLSGSLRILKLENIKTREQAADASLCSKQDLKKIELQWSDLQDEMNPIEEEILTCLEPPLGIQELKILYYSGGNLPNWISKPSFSEMISITLHKCRHCSNLPSLGLLPSLKHLSIIGMNEVLEINSLFCGEQGHDQNQSSFPALENLSFCSMSKLEKWTEMRTGNFPRLKNLTIESCPKFNCLPSLTHLNSLMHMVISYCPELSCLPDGILPSTLESLMIKDCPKLKGRCSSDGGEDWPKIAQVPVFYIDGMKIHTK